MTAIAYETVEVNRRLPLLEPMSEIAGRMSVIVGGYFLAKHARRQRRAARRRAGGVAGKSGGAGRRHLAGVNAARMATGLGADVTILEVDVERMRFLDITHAQRAHALFERGASAGAAARGGSADRRGAGAGRAGAEADYPRDAALYEAGQRAGGYRDRPGRLRGDFPADHAPRSRFTWRKG